jgi:general secretion pathway protein G
MYTPHSHQLKGTAGRRASGAARRAFTIVEVMIVLAIILILATLVAVNLRGSSKDAKLGAAKIGMRALDKALERFNDKFGRYPTDEEGLAVLWDKSKLQVENESDAAKWERLVDRAEDAEKDPWGTPWGYRQKDESGDGSEDIFDLYSFGPDRQDGTEDDIHNRAKSGESGSGAPSDSGASSGG